MKSVKLISLAITMLISFFSFGQENDSLQNKKPRALHCAATITKNNEALIVVDGLSINRETLAKIKPEKIESVKVIKGIEALALYGNKGKNGVIIIKTKSLSRKERRKLKKQSKLSEQES